jgi:probable HAF family extracellular repeat protein
MRRIESSKSASEPLLASLVVIPEGDLRFVLLPEIETFVWDVAQTAAAFRPIVMPSSNHAQPAPLNAGWLRQPQRQDHSDIKEEESMRCVTASFALNLSFALLAAQSATAQKFAITDLGTLPGGTSSVGNGIDSFGQVTGDSETSVSPAHAFLYSNGKMSDLGTLPGGTRSVGYAISGAEKRTKKERGRENENADTAQVTGYANIAGGANRAFLYRNGNMSDLGVLPAFVTDDDSYSGGVGINDSGQVVGYSGSFSLGEHAFLYSDGKMIDLGTLPGGLFSEGSAINSSGHVTGMSDTPTSGPHAFLYSDGKMSDLGTLPGGTSSSGTGINDFGEVTGVSDAAQLTGGDVHAFLYSNGTMLDLGTLPGQSSSIGRGINLSGQVVGYTTSGQNTNFRPFLYSDGIMKDLNDLIPKNSGWSLWYAFAINDRGQITGYGSHNGAIHAFLLTPRGRDDN